MFNRIVIMFFALGVGGLFSSDALAQEPVYGD
jgi:hypothetical protein